MATKVDADGTYEETIQDNGIIRKVYTSISAAYQTRMDDAEAAVPVDYVVCIRTTTVLASGKEHVEDTGCTLMQNLTQADIDELKGMGKTVLKDGVVQ